MKSSGSQTLSESGATSSTKPLTRIGSVVRELDGTERPDLQGQAPPPPPAREEILVGRK